jgi:phosphatidylserine decarboxylase
MLVLDIGALTVLPLIVLLLTRNGMVTLVTFLFILVFMYSPDRETITYNQNIFYSPSAGYVQNIVEDQNNINITLFLNVFDNHTQYFPLQSKIISSNRISGLFEPAYYEHSINNEKVEHVLQSVHHNFNYKITQITGLLTRRIHVMATNTTKVYKAGNRLGFIMFGSRVDISVPKKVVKKVLIKPNTHIQEMTEIIQIYHENNQ